MALSKVHLPTSKANHAHDDTAVLQQSNTALAAAKRNLRYLYDPSSSTKPGRFRTRALLRSVRYLAQFIFWRLVRWAKYAAVGAVAAAIGATAFGTMVSGVGWVLAPPSIGASVIAASVWGTGKFAARRLHKRWQRTGGDEGQVVREEVEDSPVRREGSYGMDVGPKAVPW